MKIYEIGTGYTPIPAQVSAATESVVEELTKAFMKMGQAVEILDISTNSRASHNLPITEIKVPTIFAKSDVSLGIVHKLKRVVYSLALASRLKKILKTVEGKTVLHFHNQYNLFFFLKTVPQKLRAKAVIAYTNHNGVWSLPWETAQPTLRKKYFQEIECMKKADIAFVLNSKMKENAVKHFNIPTDKIVQINNGVNTDVYSPLTQAEIGEIKKEFNLTGKRIILQVGSVYENKGQGRAIKLLAPLLKKNSDLVYVYAGGIVSKEYFTQIKVLAKNFGVDNQVIYIGELTPGEGINKIYNMASATVFLSKYEAFSLVCIEALSAGVPVVFCGDSLFEVGEGSLTFSADGFAENIEKVLGEDVLCGLKTLARENAVANYSWEKVAMEYLKVMAGVQK